MVCYTVHYLHQDLFTPTLVHGGDPGSQVPATCPRLVQNVAEEKTSHEYRYVGLWKGSFLWESFFPQIFDIFFAEFFDLPYFPVFFFKYWNVNEIDIFGAGEFHE